MVNEGCRATEARRGNSSYPWRIACHMRDGGNSTTTLFMRTLRNMTCRRDPSCSSYESRKGLVVVPLRGAPTALIEWQSRNQPLA